MIHIIVFGCIIITKNLIDCDNLVNYTRLMIQKVVAEIIVLNVEILAVKIVIVESLILAIIDVNRNNIDMKIVSIR